MRNATALADLSREGSNVVVRHAAVPGRVRFHVRGLAGSEALAARLRRRASGVVSVSTRTGCVLVKYPRGRHVDELRRELEALLREDDTAFGPQDWHAMSEDEALRRTDSRHDGLTEGEAGERRRRLGENVLAEPKAPGLAAQLFGQLANTPSLILGVSAVASLLTRGVGDAALIGVVLGGNAGIGALTERGVERVIRSLGLPEAEKATVRRGDGRAEVAAAALVPGEVVELGAGPVAADLRLLDAERLQVDESALTGESVPVDKATPAVPAKAPLGERKSMVYRGTVVVGGSGRGVVVATGAETAAGAIQALMGELRPPATPLQRQLHGLGAQLTGLACAACGAVLLAGLARGLGLGSLVRSTLALAIAAVPEGLPAVGTATLALGVRRLRRQEILVRRLGAIEAMGSITDLCLDKTGTITENRMTAREAVTPRAAHRLDGGPVDRARLRRAARRAELAELALVAGLCNDATRLADGRWQGSSTEIALARFAADVLPQLGDRLRAHPRVATRYRSQDSTYMATLHGTPDGTHYLAVKGSPEAVLERTTLPWIDRKKIRRENERLARDGLRVLGFACRRAASEAEAAREDGWTWLGLVGLVDPPRKGAKELVQAFHAAGIRTRILTGDQEATALAIGRKLGLNGGDDLAEHVFARVSPEGKLRIVQELQRAGCVTAVAGDGVNDGPALRAADVGIAMGAGAGVAREAAHVLLAQNDLETLFEVVRQGRTVRTNLEKALRFLVTTNASEIMLSLASAARGRTSLLSARQLLWLNLLTDVLPALALAFEPPEDDVMTRPPRRSGEALLKGEDWRAMLVDAASLAGAGLFASRVHRGVGESTAAFMALTVAQTLHTLSARSRRGVRLTGNHWVATSVAGSLLTTALTTGSPLLRRLLGNERASFGMWLTALGAGLGSWLAVEAAKSLRSTDA